MLPIVEPAATMKATCHFQPPVSQGIVKWNLRGCVRLTFVYGSLGKQVLWSHVSG